MNTYLTNAKIVLEDDLIENGSVLIEEGVIAAINPESVSAAQEIDIEQKMLMPGMIDLHCDALEKEVEPRSNVYFPLDFACAQADKRNACAGITTVYHALSFANDELGLRNNEFAAQIAREVHKWDEVGLVDNRVHCRYEITDDTSLPVLKDLLSENAMHLISMMDHTPGQGQFKDMAAYKDFFSRNYKKTEAEVEEILERKKVSAKDSYSRMNDLAECAHKAGISVASHDDDTPERIDTMRSIGADISEFPINLEAAQAAKKAGMATIYGAPNILRGKSQSGSMRAIDAIHEGVADILCSDYSPASLIVAVMRIPEQTDLSISEAVNLVTANPARAAKLDDRGSISKGKRADLIVIDHPQGLPQVRDVWVKGQHIYQAAYGH